MRAAKAFRVTFSERYALTEKAWEAASQELGKKVSMGLTVSRQTAENLSVTVKKNYFLFTVNRQKCRLILTVKKFQAYGLPFQVIANLTISADLQGILAPEETLKGKNQFPCSEKILFSRQ